MLVGPAGGGRLRQFTVDDGPMEEVESVVVGRAAVERGDRDVVVGLVDGTNSKEVAHEVRVGAGRPRLETARRHRVGEWRQAGAGQIAVVDRQGGGTSGIDAVDTSTEHDVVARPGGVDQLAARMDMGVAGSQTMLGRTRRELGCFEPGMVRCDVMDVDVFRGVCGPVGDPSRGLQLAGRPKVAAGDGQGHGTRRHDGEQQTMEADGARVGGGQPGDRAVVLGQQRVGRRRRWQHAFGGAEHDDDVDVEADRTGEWADGDAVADPSLARAVTRRDRPRAPSGTDGA